MNNARILPGADVRLRRGAEHLTRLGARSTAEFLAEVARDHGIEDDLLARLDLWRDLVTPAMVAAAGADRFPPLVQAVP
jgi:hypothetical protein